MKCNRNITRTVGAMAMCILCLFTSACSKEHKPKYRIAVSQCSQDDWRMQLNEEINREAIFYDDIDIEIRSADDDNLKQKDDLRYFANSGFDIIIVAPTEADALTPLIDSIYLAGIPVIIFDRDTNSDNYTLFQGADNTEVGRAAAKYALLLSSQPKVLELEGKLETTPAQERHQGFSEIINNTDNAEIMASVVGDWTYECGRAAADSLLRKFPQANIIYAHNDRMAIGASEAAKSLGIRDKLKIIGIDASPQIGIKAVIDSVIDATFIYPTGGRALVQAALSILNGDPHPKKVILPTHTAVNLTNAEIILLQDKAIKEETKNIRELKAKSDTYWKEYNTQTTILYGTILILVLLSIMAFLLLRSFWAQRRHREFAESQNRRLTQQHQEIERQNDQLRQKNDEINEILSRLQQATQSKLTFFTNVSHDLRTPLTLIAEPLAQLSEASNLTENQQKLTALASKNAKILMRLINQILDFRRYENGKLNINLTEVNLAAELRDWTEAFVEVAAKRQLSFKVEIPENEDFNMAIDVDKIERVLFNLLSNAFKFTQASGSIVVNLSRQETCVCLKVKDNGKGISKDDIDKVFDRFFKNDTVSPKGSGIGLALSKAFIELHGGTIEVESQEGRGSVFIVYLPIMHVDATSNIDESKTEKAEAVVTELAHINPEISVPSETDQTILVIDDNQDIFTLIHTLLGDKYKVLHALDGAHGIELAMKFVPDLIICDVMMPGIDGFETCRRLKSEAMTSHIPVLILTACAMDEQKIAGYESGTDAYLTKPFNSRILMARVKSLIENRRILKDIYSVTAPIEQKDSVDSALPQETKVTNIDSAFYRQFLQIIDANISNPALNVDDIASQIGVSRVQLYRKIKSLTDFAPTDLIRNIRLKRASEMLISTDLSVSEICYAVGFTSHSYFTKCYKELFGESPSESKGRVSKSKMVPR